MTNDTTTTTSKNNGVDNHNCVYGRISHDVYKMTPEQMDTFFTVGLVTIENVLTEEEVQEIESVVTKFINREVHVPDKDLCDISKPFGEAYEQWSIVNCMLPTTYYPPFSNNIFERITNNIAQQLFQYKKQKEQEEFKKENGNNGTVDHTTPPVITMVKDYDSFLIKRPAKHDAIFAWHQDMAYWPGPGTLNVPETDTCTFSLAIDDSTIENGCLRYIPYSGTTKTLRPHRPLYKTSTNSGGDREEGHAITADVDETTETISYAPAKRGSVTVHDEYIVHGSGGNTSLNQYRRTYVMAYRSKAIVDAERRIGFTHSHNDIVNWDTFLQDQQKVWSN